jgi:hypothetical protein
MLLAIFVTTSLLPFTISVVIDEVDLRDVSSAVSDVDTGSASSPAGTGTPLVTASRVESFSVGSITGTLDPASVEGRRFFLTEVRRVSDFDLVIDA